MGKSFFNSVHINTSEEMANGAGTAHDESGTAAKFASFIMAWLLAIFFCLAFWHGIYLLIRSFVSESTWQI
jgi:hypothetical protein